MNTCKWCAGNYDEHAETIEQLCRDHLAEYEGLPLYELDRMEAEQYDEYLDTAPRWM